jgi:hypothetical protein
VSAFILMAEDASRADREDSIGTPLLDILRIGLRGPR